MKQVRDPVACINTLEKWWYKKIALVISHRSRKVLSHPVYSYLEGDQSIRRSIELQTAANYTRTGFRPLQNSDAPSHSSFCKMYQQNWMEDGWEIRYNLYLKLVGAGNIRTTTLKRWREMHRAIGGCYSLL